MAWFSLFGAIWQTGYLLNRYTFTSNPSIHLPIGPMEYKTSHWSDFDRDLSQTVLVSQMKSAAKLMSGFNLRKVVIVNFGGRGGALKKFVRIMQKKEKLQSVKLVVIYVGQEQKVSSIDLLSST